MLPWRSRLSGAALLGLAMYATLGHELLTLQYLGARRWVIYGSSAHRPGPVGSNERAAAALEDLERSHRDDLLGANREGLVSAIGYCLVHLFGVGIGRLVHDAALDSSPATTPSQPQPSHSSSSSAPQPQRPPTYSTLRVSFLSTLMALGVAAFFTYSAIESFGEEFSASRRVSNSAFVFWIVSPFMLI